MSDSLSLLRQYIINHKDFLEEDDKIIFGDVYYPKETKTNYIIYGSGKNGEAKDYYTLECLAFLVKNVELQHSIYIKNASAKKIPVVPRPDRKELLSYLYGETQTSSSIDKNAPLEITMQRPQPYKKQPQQQQQQQSQQQQRGGAQSTIASLTSTSGGATFAQPAIPSAVSANSGDAIDQARKHKLDDIEKQSQQSFRDHIAKKIQQTSNTNARITDTSITDLSKELTAEKITSLKAKYLAKKRKTIIGGENDEELVAGQAELSDIDMDMLTKEILTRERVWRTRVTILESNGKEFDKNIFAILQSIKIKEEGFGGGGLNNSLDSTQNISLTTAANVQLSSQSLTLTQQQQQQQKARSLGYNRFDQERYGPKDETGGFSIDTKRTYQYDGGMTLNDAGKVNASPMSNPAHPSRTPIGSTTPMSVQLGNSSIQIKPATPVASLSTTPSSTTKRYQKPIIIVPAARTSLITLYNCNDVLQDLKYVSSEDKRKTLQNITKESEIIMHRKDDGKTLQFKVVDNINKLSREDWDRVVAVFAQGPSWQFKEWPWEGNPTEIFTRVKAFHLKWRGVNSDANIGKWSITVIELEEHKRHLDRARLLVFWDELDKISVTKNLALATGWDLEIIFRLMDLHGHPEKCRVAPIGTRIVSRIREYDTKNQTCS